jgi:hypothetical protein
MRTGLLLLAASTIGAAGCVIGETRGGYGTGQAYAQGTVVVGQPEVVYTNNLPPDPLYEERPAPPAYGYVWLDGYWQWRGEWQWRAGHWEAPRQGYVYIQPYYGEVDGRYQYTPGYWEVPSRVPGGVVVHDHSDGRPATGYWNGNRGAVPRGPEPGTNRVHDRTVPQPVQPAPVQPPYRSPPPAPARAPAPPAPPPAESNRVHDRTAPVAPAPPPRPVVAPRPGPAPAAAPPATRVHEQPAPAAPPARPAPPPASPKSDKKDDNNKVHDHSQ